MEKGEPTLVPEWLRSTGSVSGGANLANQMPLASSNSDVSVISRPTRGRNLKSNGDIDSPRSAFLDRSSSSNSRRSSDGSSRRAYNSFARSHRDKDRDRDKERLDFGDFWDHDSSDALGSILTSRAEKDMLRLSHSMVTRKQVDGSPRRVSVDLNNGSGRNHSNGYSLISSATTGTGSQQAVFEKDFPSLGSEERHGIADVGRVASPGLSSVQNLPVSSSTLGGEGWTSALAEVPAIIGTSSLGCSASVQTAGTGSSAMAGLNMAETVAQPPSRARTPPQISVQTQRLEELAIRQSRQLIPVTPSLPKSLVLHASDKSKPKNIARPGDINTGVKSMQQQASFSVHSGNQPVPVGHTKSDTSKTSHGKLFILKQNGVTLSPKDVASPTTNSNWSVSSQAAVPVIVQSASRSPKNLKLSSEDRKSASFNLTSGLTMEKKTSLSQTQSRHNFFKKLKEKTATNTPTALHEAPSGVSSPRSQKSCEENKECASDTDSPQEIANGAETNENGGHCKEVQRFSEEETAFLRSLGWEENTDDDEGLTEEEINTFYQEYMKRKPSLSVCQGVQQKILESQTSNIIGVSAELSSSDSESEA